MAYASELVSGGMSPGTAASVGGTSSTIAALGSTQTDAAPLTASNVIVSAADGTKGVILIGQAGDEVTVFNNSASTLKVWPPVGDAITVNGTGLGTLNASFAHLTYKVVTYKAITSSQWFATVSA